MLRFLARRFAGLFAVLLAVTALAFGSLNVLGDPLFNVVGFIASVDCDAVLAGEVEDISGRTAGGRGDCEVIQEAKREHHLDRAVPIRYAYWLGDIVRGDFGISFKNEMPVSTVISEKLPKSILLMAVAEVIGIVISIPWAIAAAYRANRRFDRASTVTPFGMLAIPNFALGIILFYFFVLRRQIFPSRF